MMLSVLFSFYMSLRHIPHHNKAHHNSSWFKCTFEGCDEQVRGIRPKLCEYHKGKLADERKKAKMIEQHQQHFDYQGSN